MTRPFAHAPRGRSGAHFLALIAVLAGHLLSEFAHAQTGSGATTSLNVTSLADAVDALVSRSGYIITLERPRFEYSGDLEEIPTEHRRDLDQYPKGGAPRILQSRGNAFSLKLPGESILKLQDISAVLQQIVQTQSMSDHGGHFHVEQTGEAFHLVPTEVQDRDGNWVAYHSILDALITIPAKDRSALETVEAVCAAVSTGAHAPVMVLQAPMMLLLNSREVLSAKDESARTVLTRALAGMNQKLTWNVFYDVPARSYMLLIFVVPDKTSSPVTAQGAPTGPAAPNGNP
jgi:hypothetical protein